MAIELRAILVDDEIKGREVLRNLLQRFFPEIEILDETESVEQAYKSIALHKPNLVFLDIEMPGSSGFNLLRKFDVIPFEVIFVTSYDQYAITAIKFSALDYLLKPVEVSDLREAVQKAKRSIETKQQKSSFVVNLLNNFDDVAFDKKVAVHDGDKVVFVSAKEIIYIQADGSYCKISVAGGKRFTTAKFLKDFETFFGEKSSFVRIHKSCMINADHITNYSKGEPCFIEMNDGVTFEVARRKKQEVLEKLKNNA
jgi:two-component system LytT family response regulator